MGKGQKRKSHRNHAQRGRQQQKQHKNHNKRRKKAPRCWIEECPETETHDIDNNNDNNREETAVDVELTISRVLLFDNHSSSRVDLPTTVDAKKDANNNNSKEPPHAPPTNHTDMEKGTEQKDADRVDAGATQNVASRCDANKAEPCVIENQAKSAINESTVDNGDFSATGEMTTTTVTTTANVVNSDKNVQQLATESSALTRDHPSTPADQDEDDSLQKETNDAVRHPVKSPTTDTDPDAATVLGGDELRNARVAVRRHPSARGSIVFPKTGFVHLPNGDCGDGIVNPHPDAVEDKYWAQRHRLFERFEQGIQLDREGWYSVTPQAIADHVAQKMTTGGATASTPNERKQQGETGSMIVLDAFVGVGGNAIAFAKRDEVGLVICVDSDPNRLALAANNCRVYDISPAKVLFVCADAVTVLRAFQNGKRMTRASATAAKARETTQPETEEEEDDMVADKIQKHGYNFVSVDQLPERVDAIFLSPPWGGSEYSSQRHFDLESIQVNETVNGADLLQLAVSSMSPDRLNLAYFLPRNTNGWRIGECAHRAGLRTIEMEQNYLNHKLKTITLYARGQGS